PPLQDQVTEVQEAAPAAVVEAAEGAVGEIAREAGTCVLATTAALVRGRFRGWVHPVLRHFMRATCKRFNLQTIKMIQWHATLANCVALFNCFRNVRLSQRCGFD